MPISAAGASFASRAVTTGGDPERMGREWVPVLADVPLFSGLSRRHLRRIAGLARTRRYAAKTTIVRAGDPGNAFYVILDGKARVVPPNGRAIVLRRGDSFGEMALLDGSPRSATVIAEEETFVLWVGAAGFTKLLRKEPTISLALLGVLAARLREAQRGRSY